MRSCYDCDHFQVCKYRSYLLDYITVLSKAVDDELVGKFSQHFYRFGGFCVAFKTQSSTSTAKEES